MRSDAASEARPAPARRRGPLAFGIVLGIAVLDQLTKAWVVAALGPHDGPGSGHVVSIVGDTIELRLARNTGGAFSLFQGFTPILAALAIVVAVVLVRTVRRTEDPVLVVALALVLGGAIGNFIDRVFRSPGVFRGAVVDFVRVGDFPSFNVADSAITIGAVLLVLRVAFASPGDARTS